MATEHFSSVAVARDRLPTVAALEALWLQVSARPLWLPPHFWRYVRLSRRLHLHPLSRKDVKISVPRPVVTNCKACTDICCIGKKNTVPLRFADIAALIDLQRTDLIAETRPAFSDEEQSRARQRFTQSRTFAVFPVLRQDALQRCLALTRDNRCSLFPNWPLACARFPYALDLEDREIFYSPRCGSHKDAGGFEDARIRLMVDATLAAYNQRIRDWILLDYEPEALDKLGLMRFVTP